MSRQIPSKVGNDFGCTLTIEYVESSGTNKGPKCGAVVGVPKACHVMFDLAGTKVACVRES